jgi:hypothetical protein
MEAIMIIRLIGYLTMGTRTLVPVAAQLCTEPTNIMTGGH